MISRVAALPASVSAVRARVIASLVAFATGGFSAQVSSADTTASPVSRSFAIVHARVYTMMDESPLEDATLVVDDGKVVSVARGGTAPAGVTIVDARGHIVTPGLFNAATQLGLLEIAGDADTTDQSVDSGPLGAAFDPEYALDPNSLAVQKARADGVSRALVYPGGSGSAPFSGLAALLRLRPGVDLLERPQVALVATVGGASAAHAGGSRSEQWQLLRNALDEAKRAGSKSSLAADERLLNRLDLAAVRRVFDPGIPLLLVTNRESDLRQAIRLQDDYKLRVIVLGGAEAWRVAPELARAQIPVILDPYADLPMSYDEIGSRRDNAARLASAGVTIAFMVSGQGIYLTYDAGSVLREAAGLAVANGLGYVDALRALTVNPARIWGVEDRSGRLERGRDADLVIWDGDPLEPTSAPVQVFVGGESVPLRTRQTELRDRYRPSTARPGSP
jgi:imidazolonepropionase-like amidohydrolase